MMIVLPLVPILIGIFCILLGAFSEIQESINTITIILIIIASLIFLGIIIFNWTKKKSIINKIVTTATCLVSDFASMGIILYFMEQIGKIEFSVLGLVEFLFVLVVGGCICVAIIIGLISLCFGLAERGINN